MSALRFADDAVRAQGFEVRRVSRPVQVVYLVAQLDFEMTTGGALQWLTNSSGRHARETVTALHEIGADVCARIVAEILAFFPNAHPAGPDDERLRQIEALIPTAEPTWRDLGHRLTDWPENVDALLRRYVAAHPSDFVNPRM
jgi:hypothetical protein